MPIHEKIVKDFVKAWTQLREANLDVCIVFEDGTEYKFLRDPPVEIIWESPKYSNTYNP